MDNPSNSPADAAYGRALAAFQERSYDVARRWAVEALAHNRQHAGARALMARLDAARSAVSPFQGAAAGSEVVSTDPTILISRASGSQPMSDAIEPTVMVRRDDLGRRPADTDPRVTFPPLPPPRSGGRPSSEPTMIAQPRAKSGSSRQKSSFSLGGALKSLGERLQPGQGRQHRSSASHRPAGSLLSTPAARGVMFALAMVVVGAVVVWGLYGLVRWMWPAGQVLTITAPTGGTITGPGIECGSHGTRCSASFTSGDTVELATAADDGYVFSGYSGSCAPTGRIAMTESRTCGATFGRVEERPKQVTFRLTIVKPEGGTVIVAGGILCGTTGSTCSADIPSGAPVSLKPEADDGYVWQEFTRDCPSTGVMTMTSEKTCGATFVKTLGPATNAGVVRAPSAPPPKPKSPPVAVPPPPTGPGQGAATSPQVTTNPNTQPSMPPQPQTMPVGPTTPAQGPKTADDHAKEEIKTLVDKYCAALESTKADQLRTLFHNDVNQFKTWFKEVKSLKCTVTSPPAYDRLDSSDAGGAQLKFGMKMVVKMSTSGAPETRDLIVTMVVSRKGFQNPFLIDRVQTDEKPK